MIPEKPAVGDFYSSHPFGVYYVALKSAYPSIEIKNQVQKIFSLRVATLKVVQKS